MPLRDTCATILRTPRAIKIALEVLDEIERERERATQRKRPTSPPKPAPRGQTSARR